MKAHIPIYLYKWVEPYGLTQYIILLSQISISIDLSSEKLQNTLFQNEFNFPASTSKPFLFKYRILSPPHRCIELKSKVFQGEKFSGSNSLLIHDIFNAQQKDLIWGIFNPPISYPLIITVHLIYHSSYSTENYKKMSCISFITYL